MPGLKSQSQTKLVGPAARVAPSAEDTQETNTILLFPVHLEFLSVQVLFHGVGVPELKVKLSSLDGSEVAGGLLTDEKGKATLPRRVPAGVYVCELEQQERAQVCTVTSPADGFVVVLPVGRPYADVRERVEFARAHAPKRGR
jgi:hypothetical protein